jgi:hypothetical protein
MLWVSTPPAVERSAGPKAVVSIVALLSPWDVFVLSFSALDAIWSLAKPQSTPELTLDFLRACSWKFDR